MPIYEYRCADCDRSFEILMRSGHDDDAECPHCSGRRLERELSTFAARSGNGNGAVEGGAMCPNGGARMGAGGCCGAGGCGCH